MSVALPDHITGLTEPEAEFVYLVEVLGMPARAAAERSGLSLGVATKPHVQQARALVKQEIRGSLNITKEDVVHGMHEAIGRARLLAEPMTELVGWEKIAKLLGFDAPQKVDINITESVGAMRAHLRALPDAELARLAGAQDIIDVEFYEPQGAARSS